MKAEDGFHKKKLKYCQYFCWTKSILKACLYSEINIQVKHLTCYIDFLQGLFYCFIGFCFCFFFFL